MNDGTILVTGGAGYIGSHTVVELMQSGFEVVIVDNLDNSDACVIERIGSIVGRKPQLVVADIRDVPKVTAVLQEFRVDAVIHFAGLKSVSESCAEPLRYYDVNVVGTLRLLQAMAEARVSKMVFSSSTTVYGNPTTVPITEDAPLIPACPYGQSKLTAENILRDVAEVTGSNWKFALLRYFNPVGAHESGTIGEDPHGVPTNLMPYVSQVAVGRRRTLVIFGQDYPTKDGTAIRDFIHVVDLARGHLAALRVLADGDESVFAVNLGTGRGTSVLELVSTFAEVTGVPVPYEFATRRQGDVAICFADASRALNVLGWKAERDLRVMCRDAWNWQSRNPHGYGTQSRPSHSHCPAE
jgi:UDP-glucose 4-epimerase